MTARPTAARPFGGSDAKRNFILQQGLCDPGARACTRQYSALLFQPRLVGLWLVAATVLQSPLLFFALAATLWWSATVPRLNPFDALYNWILASSSGVTLDPAPAPRRFAQLLAGSFALAIGGALGLTWRPVAFVLEGFFVVAVSMVVFGGFCPGSYLFHLLRGRAEFARRTLPWATGA
jgi:Domain of unknown function (DUF4395)